jgi:hypothetical protein
MFTFVQSIKYNVHKYTSRMGTTTIELLKSKGVTDMDLEIFNQHLKGGEENNFTSLGKKYKKSPVTISRRVKKVQKVLKELEAGVKPGDVSLQNKGLAQSPATQGAGKLALPSENPFSPLQTFAEMSGITNATGSVLGLGAAMMYNSFTREDLPLEERQIMTMKGASALAGSLLSMYLTFQKFTAENQPKQPVDITPKETEANQ